MFNYFEFENFVNFCRDYFLTIFVTLFFVLVFVLQQLVFNLILDYNIIDFASWNIQDGIFDIFLMNLININFIHFSFNVSIIIITCYIIEKKVNYRELVLNLIGLFILTVPLILLVTLLPMYNEDFSMIGSSGFSSLLLGYGFFISYNSIKSSFHNNIEYIFYIISCLIYLFYEINNFLIIYPDAEPELFSSFIHFMGIIIGLISSILFNYLYEKI